MTPEKIFEVAEKIKPEKFPFADGDEIRAFDKAHLIAFGQAIAKAKQEEMQGKIESLYKMYEMASKQRDVLMDQLRAQVEAMRGRIQ